mgnify:CR=1 FL=1
MRENKESNMTPSLSPEHLEGWSCYSGDRKDGERSIFVEESLKFLMNLFSLRYLTDLSSAGVTQAAGHTSLEFKGEI